MLPVLLSTLIPTLIGFGGSITGIVISHVSWQRLNLLVYMAAGVLFAVTVFDVLPDAKDILSWPAFLAATLSGYLLFWLIGRYVYPICPACTLAVFKEETGRRVGQTTVLLLMTLGLHSMMDGMAIVLGDRVAFSSGHETSLGIALGVSVHKLPEGLALALLLMGAGYTRRNALFWALTIEGTTIIGGLLGILIFASATRFWIGLLFGHVGGGFLYLVTSALQVFTGSPARLPARSLVTASGLSFLLTASLLWAVRHFAE